MFRLKGQGKENLSQKVTTGTSTLRNGWRNFAPAVENRRNQDSWSMLITRKLQKRTGYEERQVLIDKKRRVVRELLEILVY